MAPRWWSGFLVAFFCLQYLTVSADQIANRRSGVSYRGQSRCPERCGIVGPEPGNWSVYHNLDQLASCQQQVFLDFSVADHVDDPKSLHRIRACTMWTPDLYRLPIGELPVPAVEVNTTYQVGWWDGDGGATITQVDTLSLIKQMRGYFGKGHGLTNRTSIVFGRANSAAVGLYIGKALQNEGMAEVALGQYILNTIGKEGVSGGVAMQLCEPGWDADHVFGFMATIDGSFGAIQDAMALWSRAECISSRAFSDTVNITGSAFVTSPPLSPILNGNSTFLNYTDYTNTTQPSQLSARARVKRADCTTVQVIQNDSCASLAVKCGISGATFTSYNPSSTLCSTLQPGQHVCCSAGTLPDFRPKPNSDGSCATYTTIADDNCYSIAASNSLTVDDLENFNTDTWAWNGCDNLWVGVIMCLSTGSPPMPAPVSNAVCGPQVPGTAKPDDMSTLTDLNPCLLNACCDVWGQCGTTVEFCIDTNTGAPGTAAKGTNGCISNCGTNLILSPAPAQYMSVGYFEGYNLGRSCLNMDVRQLDMAQYTHLHFAFATLTPDFQVVIGDDLATYEFNAFLAVKGPKKILSFGGWDFSTNPGTYTIFRDMVATASNRLTAATNIANFIIANNLDGVDMDWEYPGAPDIPNIPPADKSDGINYLSFLVILKNILGSRSVSIAAPSSYWYLKGYPIEVMSLVVDYIIYMTYDLHGQWDYNNKWSDPGCPGGNCLRSGVNLTETINSLVMITKAGVPSNKVIVGVTSYGRSYQMTTPGCWGEMCTFTGPESGATHGPCTDTAGYISDAEIKEILASDRVTYSGTDPQSDTDILVYDGDQWVGWMSPSNRAARVNLYKALNFGGVTNWAVDLEDYTDVPYSSSGDNGVTGGVTLTWSDFKTQIKAGSDPSNWGARTGNWTTLSCTDPAITNTTTKEDTPAYRWAVMDAPNAWTDAVNRWTAPGGDRDQGNLNFIESIWNTYHGSDLTICGSLLDESNCDSIPLCVDNTAGSGPAGYLVMASLIEVHELHKSYYDAISQATSDLIWQNDLFDATFAPLPDPEENELMLQILLDLVGVGTMFVGAPFFNGFLKSLPYFASRSDAVFDNAKDAAYASIAGIIAIAKDLIADSKSAATWDAEAQNNLTAYLGATLLGWKDSAQRTVTWIFNGTDEAIEYLSGVISDGKLIEGSAAGQVNNIPEPPSASQFEAWIWRTFYAFAIPTAWSFSGKTAFIIESGIPCDQPDTYEFTDHGLRSVCFGGEKYFLASLTGTAYSCTDDICPLDSDFWSPNGVSALDGVAWGGVTVEDIVLGSIQTKLANAGNNGGSLPDASDRVLFDAAIGDTINLQTPGIFRLPICGWDEAHKNWDAAAGYVSGFDSNYPSYPCDKETNDISDIGNGTVVVIHS
ncbi:glycoside hydrolase family 18 protein [Xylariales sp. PMI_506]|nr:glycoside hydrolase family 18 protein [Xylariales sp. PMI_506]